MAINKIYLYRGNVMKYLIFSMRFTWLTLSILILYFTLKRLSLVSSVRDASELISVMSYGMVIISFPTGIVFLFY